MSTGYESRTREGSKYQVVALNDSRTSEVKAPGDRTEASGINLQQSQPFCPYECVLGTTYQEHSAMSVANLPFEIISQL